MDFENNNSDVVKAGKTTSIESLEPEPIQPRPWYVRFGRRLIGLLFIFAMLFLGGIYQLGLFQQTPASVPAGEYQPVIEQEVKTIPTTVYVLEQSRKDTNVTTTAAQLVERTNAVLRQARVQLDPVQTNTIQTDDLQSRTGRLASSPDKLRDQLPELRDDRLHVIVARGLGGINGVAFPGEQVVAVAEYTTSFDFRVLAHEVGHILSLDHVDDKSNLMFSGSDGTQLTVDQAKIMNKQSTRF